MANTPMTPGIVPERLPDAQIAENFSDLAPPLTRHEASVAADRCYFCYDAPCITACPTSIDIPLFIRQIQTGVPEEAAMTIFSQNILGGMCARVCPTETLCEEACVREAAEGQPVEIGRLQRFATDELMNADTHPFERGEPTGKKVAVVGAGPAGLACAHRLAMYGHDVMVLDKNKKPGGLNEFGIAQYKTVEDFAQSEVEWLASIGGIKFEHGAELGAGGVTLEALLSEYDAVFLGVGLGDVNAIEIEGDTLSGVRDAVDFIAELRQTEELSRLSVGRNVVVIGGGMTAVDAAVQTKLLGAENVSIVYRREQSKMGASKYEQDLATSKGVRIIPNAQPVAIQGQNEAEAVKFERTRTDGKSLKGTGEHFQVAADQVLKAIGQTLEPLEQEIEMSGGKIAVTDTGRSSIDRVWAGGDCASGGDDLTVTAVAEGRDAAEDIHLALSGK